MMNINVALIEDTDLVKLQENYEAQAVYLWSRPLQEHFEKIGCLLLVTSSTPEPLLKKFFNSKAQDLFASLCNIFGLYEIDHVFCHFVFMMAQILQYGMISIFDFASFLAEEIHTGLVGIGKGKVDKPFGWY